MSAGPVIVGEQGALQHVPPEASTAAVWTAGNGSPEAAVLGSPGDLWTQLDAAGGPVLWCKVSGAATNTGWGALVPMNALAAIYGQMFLGMSSTGQVPTGKLHGSNAGIQYSSDFGNRAQARFNQYGPNAAGGGITTFKSRGGFGTTAAVQANDLLGRWTAIGISADNASLNLAALVSIYASGAPTATKVPCRWEVELTTLAGNRELSCLLTSEGELSAKGPIGPGDGSSAGASTGPRWRTGAVAPNGAVVGSPGDLYSNTAGAPGATLWVKDSGVATTAGWRAI